jgi:hypothetical protein
MDFCLLNTLPINKKELALKDSDAVDNNLDIFALTKTWLRNNDQIFYY